ncbi:MAG: hypothetical protein A2066_21730 [Bacteroidetes bacterium GWB2_41_8]|nr:MAG: hypothetical protein A2066_21730 [Bacteroidetes bacterium GWB2_41_8]
MPYINSQIRTIQIDEEDYNLIYKYLDVARSKCYSNAARCNTVNRSVSSEMKAKANIDEADLICDLLSRLSTEMI